MNGTATNGKIELPYWARVAMFIIKELGLPVFMILVIFGMWAGFIESPTSRQHEEILKRSAGYQDAQEDIKSLFHVSLATCINQARDKSERDRCLMFHD